MRFRKLVVNFFYNSQSYLCFFVHIQEIEKCIFPFLMTMFYLLISPYTLFLESKTFCIRRNNNKIESVENSCEIIDISSFLHWAVINLIKIWVFVLFCYKLEFSVEILKRPHDQGLSWTYLRHLVFVRLRILI